MELHPLYEKTTESPEGTSFAPRLLSAVDFTGTDVPEAVVAKAVSGSEFFKARYDKGILFPKLTCSFEEIDASDELEVHNYTGQCPVQTFEINPVKGCSVGCAYCLVNDGVHDDPVVYINYDKLIAKRLSEQWETEHYYYFSPKTEALCEASLQTGAAHSTLRAFIKHYNDYPASKARLFIASKAGREALLFKHDGESILDLLIKLKGKVQFNTSLSIFPDDSISVIEPYASSLDSRFAAVRLCQENGIMANSALVQPILVSILTDDLLESFFEKLQSNGIINFKPEFLTASIENMTLISQLLESYDNDILRKVFSLYFRNANLDHIKQRARTAPTREESIYWIGRMIEIAERYGITASICYWVRQQLSISEDLIPIVNKNGFKCLGYQTRLFETEA